MPNEFTLAGRSIAALLHRRLIVGHRRTRSTEARNAHLPHLERLGLLSPHLLADLGFAPDPERGNMDETCWRRGTVRVVLSRLPGPSTARASDE
jgi:hypothetical protein